MIEPHMPVPAAEAEDVCLTCGRYTYDDLDGGVHDEAWARTYADVAGALVEVESAIAGATHSWEALGGAVLAEMSVYRAVDLNGRPVLADLLAAKANLLVAKVSILEGCNR